MLGFATLNARVSLSLYVAPKYPKYFTEKAEDRSSVIKTLQFKSEVYISCFNS